MSINICIYSIYLYQHIGDYLGPLVALLQGMSTSAKLVTKSPRRVGMAVALLAALVQVAALSAQRGRPIRLPMPHDWSHRHVIFSAPSSDRRAQKLQQDPRYRHQSLRRNASSLPDVKFRESQVRFFPAPDPPNPNALHRDWGSSLAASGTGGNEMFPAKFSFDVNAVPSCPNDFVVYNTSVTPTGTAASATGTFTGNSTNNQTATITNGASSVTLTAVGAQGTGTATVVSVPSVGDTVTFGSSTYTFAATTATGTVTVSSVPTAGDTVTIGSSTYTFAASTATGTATISSVPTAGDTVTIGSTTYTFVATLVNANDILFVTGSTSNSARSLQAAINANSTQCSSAPCYGTGTTANASVTATRSGSVVTATAITTGSSGNSIALATVSGGRITLSGATLSGGNGAGLVNANDVLFVTGSTTNSAVNLRATIDANSGQCNTTPCFGTGTTANASVTATQATNVVTVSAITGGSGGNSIALTTSSGAITLSGATLSGGNGGLVNPNDVLIVSGSTTNSARNLRATIGASSVQCFASPCFGTGTTANASVTATQATNVVTATAISWGTAGNVTLATSSGGRVTVSGATLTGGIDQDNTGANFGLNGNTTTAATNLAAAVNRNGATVGVSATSATTVVTVTATTAGAAGNSITLAKTLGNFTWSAGTLSGGADGRASIIAYNNLYSTQGSVGGYCNHDGPSVMWSYKTNSGGNTTGTNVTSPVLSLDGTKVVYVETNTNANGGASLHILAWKSGQGTAIDAPVAPDQVVADWSSCTGGNSCIVDITFNGAQADTNSSPFYDYTGDALYVGDDNGVLHKFTPVMTGTPSEVTTGGWPVTVHSGFKLSSPVFDSGSGNIFVGDSGGRVSYVRDSASTVGTCASGNAPCLGLSTLALGGSIVDAPLIDSSIGKVFVFNGKDSTNGGVHEADTALSSASHISVNVGGTSASGSAIHSGTFDDTYMNSPVGTGYLFVCGKGSGVGDRPAIHRIGIQNGVMNGSSDGALTVVSSSFEECSPVSEIYNTATSTDWIFFSVGKNNNQTAAGCSATAGATGCVMSLNLTALGSTWPPTTVTKGYPVPDAPAGGAGVTASTSGIIIDNVANSATYPQASSIYFSFVSNAVTGGTCNGATGVGCAVKLTQAALQ